MIRPVLTCNKVVLLMDNSLMVKPDVVQDFLAQAVSRSHNYRLRVEILKAPNRDGRF